MERRKYSQPPGPEVAKYRNKKDTKRWCKGVVGREHKPVAVLTEMVWGSVFRDKYCEVCRKHLGCERIVKPNWTKP